MIACVNDFDHIVRVIKKRVFGIDLFCFGVDDFFVERLICNRCSGKVDVSDTRGFLIDKELLNAYGVVESRADSVESVLAYIDR